MGINCQIHDTCPYCGKSYHGFIGDPPVCPNRKHLL